MLTRLVGLLCLLLCVPATSMAEPALDRSRPVYMDADKLGYDQSQAIVIAKGNVRVVQGQSILYAERITYYQDQNIVLANGNVRVEDQLRGETYYADEVRLKDDLMQGVIENFRVRMADHSQFAAREARRMSETRIELSKAVYSPCKICKGESPLWQLKAGEVKIDEDEQRIEYEDVTLELKGFPVAYSPYFSHPTPDANAKSGFLAPTYAQDSNLGFSLRTPYYFAIAPDKEAIITPFLTSKEGPALIGYYRQLFDSGFLQLDASGTYPFARDDDGIRLSDREFRGHIYAQGQTALNEHWGVGFDLRRTTDDTYLRRYDFGFERSLNSRLFAEGLYGRSYVSIEGLAFQGLDEDDDPDLEPFVLPLAQAHYESDSGLWGIAGLRHYGDANLQVIARNETAQSRRLSLAQGLRLPLATSGGHLVDVTLENRLDLYSVADVTQRSGKDFNGEQARIIPTAAVKWRYPLIKKMQDSSLTIEPTILAVARPNGGNSERIPNEDNLIAEFSDANLFAINPFPGLDTIDEGSRIAVGLSGHWWMGSRRNLFFTAGQSYSLQDETPFPYNDDPDEHLSDYVGRVSFDYDPFEFTYRFRVDQDELVFNNQSVSTAFFFHPVNFTLDYITFNNDAFLDDREEVVGTFGMALSEEWSINAFARRDLLLDTMLFAGGGLTYFNECFTLDAAFSRAFIRDRDLEPENRFSIRLGLKNLTEM